jgi:hypothetical protein
MKRDATRQYEENCAFEEDPDQMSWKIYPVLFAAYGVLKTCEIGRSIFDNTIGKIPLRRNTSPS